MKKSSEQQKRQKTLKKGMINGALFVFLLFLILACLCIGKYSIAPEECIRILFGKLLHLNPTWSGMDEKLLIGIRLPRTMATVIVGAALALSGAVYQGIFKNPLVSPDFLGVSSGACVVVDGVDGRGIKRMLNEFKED
jgi:iron complex transport system permease protein